MSSSNRTKQVNVWLTPDEKGRLEKRAREQGMSVQRYVRYRSLQDTPVAFVAKQDLDYQLAGLTTAIESARAMLRGDKEGS